MTFFQKISALVQYGMSSPFYKGVCCGVLAVLLLWLLWKIVKLILFLCFGPRRCRMVRVPGEGGEILVSSEALSHAVRAQLKPFAGLEISRISVYRKKKDYQLELRCCFHGGAKTPAMPELFAQIKPLLTERLGDLFGIRNISRIKLRLDDYDGPDAMLPGKVTPPPIPAPEKTAETEEKSIPETENSEPAADPEKAPEETEE